MHRVVSRTAGNLVFARTIDTRILRIYSRANGTSIQVAWGRLLQRRSMCSSSIGGHFRHGPFNTRRASVLDLKSGGFHFQ